MIPTVTRKCKINSIVAERYSRWPERWVAWKIEPKIYGLRSMKRISFPLIWVADREVDSPLTIPKICKSAVVASPCANAEGYLVAAVKIPSPLTSPGVPEGVVV